MTRVVLPARLRAEWFGAIERGARLTLDSPEAQGSAPSPDELFMSLHAALMRSSIAAGSLTARALSELHIRALSTRAEYSRDGATLVLTHSPAMRQSAGAYYTPESLVDLLLDHTLTHLIARAMTRPHPCVALLSLRVLDPSVGAGDFLVAVADRLAHALCLARRESLCEGLSRARTDVVSGCIYGVDSDPLAIEIARFALGPGAQLRRADALRALCPSRENTLFPEVFDRGGFDLVLGNPPFLNAINGRPPGSLVSVPSLGGTADAAYHFLSLADALANSEGYLAMIQPRSVLSAPSAAALRERLCARGVAMLYAPERASFFSGARVSIAALALGASESCLASLDPEPSAARFRAVSLNGANWWRTLNAHPGPHASGRALRERFEVCASMTVGEAYDLRSALSDAPDGPGPKFITTGLIDPEKCLWGARECRYLGEKYAHPRVDIARLCSASLARRARLWRRPKVLVAGLAARVECFFDERGECAGAVSTWTITHPTNDTEALCALAVALCAREVTEELISALGASRMGGGSITITRGFLDGLCVPLVTSADDPALDA